MKDGWMLPNLSIPQVAVSMQKSPPAATSGSGTSSPEKPSSSWIKGGKLSSW